MSLTGYSNIESGKTENITYQRLIQIAGILGVDISVMLTDESVNNNPLVITLKTELHETKEELQKANQQIENLRAGVNKNF